MTDDLPGALLLLLFLCRLSSRYLAWKHQQLLYLDALGGVYTLAIAGALTKPALFGHPATWILLLMTIIKALPHIPLMLGYKEHHLR